MYSVSADTKSIRILSAPIDQSSHKCRTVFCKSLDSDGFLALPKTSIVNKAFVDSKLCVKLLVPSC